MNYLGEVVKGTLAYTLVTFPIAVIWHVLLFEQQYLAFGYFTTEPKFVVGLVTIVIQGFVLSYLYPVVNFSGNGIGRGIKFALTMGLFFWTSHVLAFVAKQPLESAGAFIAMESFYLLIQFIIYGIFIGRIYRKSLQSGLIW